MFIATCVEVYKFYCIYYLNIFSYYLHVTCGLNCLESQLVSSMEELGVSPPKTEVRGTRVATAVAEIM